MSTLLQHFMSFISRWLKDLLALRFFGIAAGSLRDAFGSSSGWWVWSKKALLEGGEFLVFALFLAMQMLCWREQPQGGCTLLCLGVETRRETDSFNWIILVGMWLWVWVLPTGISTVIGSWGRFYLNMLTEAFQPKWKIVNDSEGDHILSFTSLYKDWDSLTS